jgi:hypothetical protein
MRKTLLTVDWDYFIPFKKEWFFSYIENERNSLQLWYKRYIMAKLQGEDLEKSVRASSERLEFWKSIKNILPFYRGVKVFVSESHKFAYYLAKNFNCDRVISFDSHSDLGYSGLASLEFEVNCANWLGKLFKDDIIKEAMVVYSPYSLEKPSDFEEFINLYRIDFVFSVDKLPKDSLISVIHIARSGAWTPPWLDKDFVRFVNSLGLLYHEVGISPREWKVSKLSYGDQIFYLNFA